MSGLFDKHGGFRKLHSFTLGTIGRSLILPRIKIFGK